MEAFVEATVEFTSVEASPTSVEASVKAFVEASSMEAFTKASVEACVFFLRGSFHIFHESFHGSFHELPRKKQLVQETAEAFMSFHAKKQVVQETARAVKYWSSTYVRRIAAWLSYDTHHETQLPRHA